MEAQAQAAEYSLDKSLTRDEALKNAILATEFYMKASKLASSDQERKRLRTKCQQLLLKAEEIKQSVDWTPAKNKELLLKAPSSERTITKREEAILLESSKLHGFVFPPWTSDPDDATFEETVVGSPSFTDPADLKLSGAQTEIFGGWKRPHEIFGHLLESIEHESGKDELSMVALNEMDLVQDITTDCSVVASLCAGTARALKGHGKLLASMIYPYDKVQGRPRVSKNGKYVFRLHFNGCFREVIIDDRLPASNSLRTLHVIDRKNPHLLWPALIEKAYLKVRGGYDFPGSNSGTDLWILTGWIPEQVFLQSDDLRIQQLWNRVLKSFGFGDVMITLGTGRLTNKEEKELGLAGEHDYAVLDMKEVGSQRSLLIKNPWCDGMVWKGSLLASKEHPEAGWTEDLRGALPDDSESTPGTFWMGFEDVVQNFESLYLNWNPGLFLNRQDHHFSWAIPRTQNPGSFTHNPQYALNLAGNGTVWVLLSRHFATGELEVLKSKSLTLADTSNALGFISLYIFESNGRRVYLSDDAFHRGAYVDSPQTLARFEGSKSMSYTVVAAQYGLPLPKYSFTLSCFSRSALTVEPAVDRFSYCTSHKGAWTSRTAGGNASAPSYPINPQFSLSVPSATDIMLVLEADKEELAVHVKMVWAGGERVTAVTTRDIVGGSGDYRRGCALADLHNVSAGKYTIVCSTFDAGQTGDFTLRVGSMVPCLARPVLAETAGRLSHRLPALIFQDADRMLAPLMTSRMTRLRVVARFGGSRRFSQASMSRPLLRISLERGQGPNKTVLDVSGNGDFSDMPMGIRTADLDVSPPIDHQEGLWLVVERFGGRNSLDEVEVEVLSDTPVRVGLWGTGDG